MESKPIRFWLFHEGEDYDVTTEAALASVGVRTQEEADAMFGGSARLAVVELKPANHENAIEIASRCQIPDEQIGLRYEPKLEPRKRFAVMVTGWNLTDLFGEPSEDLFTTGLANAITEQIDGEILARLKPQASMNRLFFRLLAARPKPSEGANPSDSPTCTPE